MFDLGPWGAHSRGGEASDLVSSNGSQERLALSLIVCVGV